MLYIFTNFAYTFELFGKLSEFDGSGMIKFDYLLINPKVSDELDLG